MNARLSPVCFGLLKYRVMVKGCPRRTVNSVLAYLSVWCVPAFADGCQLICVGVRSVKQRTRREAAASNSFAGKWRDEVAKNSYLLPEQGQLKCRCSIKLIKTSGLVTEIIACTLFRGCHVLKASILPVRCWMLLYHRTWEKKITGTNQPFPCQHQIKRPVAPLTFSTRLSSGSQKYLLGNCTFPAYVLMLFGLEEGKMRSERSPVFCEWARGIWGREMEHWTRKSI